MRRADLSKKDALVETNNNESVSTSFNKTITNTVISVLTVVMFLIAGTSINSAPYSSGLGDGSANNPYIILNLQDWNDFANDVALLSNGGFPNKYFKLGADIGTDAIPVTQMVSGGIFYGKFDGGGHTITVRFSSSPIGLFARVRSLDTVVIKNLTVRGRINNEEYLKVYE